MNFKKQPSNVQQEQGDQKGYSKSGVDAQTMSRGLVANKLTYTSPPLISLYDSRQFVKYPAQSQSYAPGRTVIINLSNSEIFVNPKNSYLRFKLTTTQAINPSFFQSAANIFERVRYVHASGVELSHHRSANGYASQRRVLHNENEWAANKAAMQQFNENVAAGTYEIAIPLSELCSVFRPLDKEVLIPPFLFSSARLELNLETYTKAFKWVVAGEYTIEDVEVVLDSYVLSDAAFSMVEAMSQVGKVEFTVEDYEVINRETGTTRLDMELNKSLGRAFETVTVITPVDATVDPLDDAFAPIPQHLIKSFQHRSNSLYMPALPATGLEHYMNVMQIKDNSIYDLGSFTDGAYIVQNLQRNDWVGVTSGLPINSSSSLRLNVELADGVDRQATQFTSHMKIIKPYLYDKCIISV